MKKILTITLLICCIHLGYTQSNLTGASAVYLKAYETSKASAEQYLEAGKYTMVNAKINAMINNLEKLKKANPSVDFSSKEKEIATLQQKAESGINQKATNYQSANDAYYQKIELNQIVSEFVNSQEPSQETIDKVKNIDLNLVDLEKHKPTVLSAADNIDFTVKTLKKDLDFGLDVAYDRYTAINQYWQICSAFYPNETKVQQAKQKLDAITSQYKISSKEAYKKEVSTKADAKIANKTMLPAVRTDKATETLFIQAFNKESTTKKWDRTLLKVNLISDDWKIKYHEVTGKILGRRQYACIVYKDNSTGNCQMSKYYEIYQEYTGSGYSTNTIGGYGTSFEAFPCENINK
ncbi:MAG: hypothetical protein H6553_00770 [Chitinophagales bacterium]|nr:hypothetical protein [Chitinophagales bacterium]